MKRKKKLTSDSVLRKALSNVLKIREYHLAPPIEKQKILDKEYERLQRIERKEEPSG